MLAAHNAHLILFTMYLSRATVWSREPTSRSGYLFPSTSRPPDREYPKVLNSGETLLPKITCRGRGSMCRSTQLAYSAVCAERPGSALWRPPHCCRSKSSHFLFHGTELPQQNLKQNTHLTLFIFTVYIYCRQALIACVSASSSCVEKNSWT